MIRRSIVYCLICFHLSHYNAAKNFRKQGRFEVALDNARSCGNPNPPFAKRSTILPKYSISIVNGKRYLSGNTTIIKPTPFQNFSGRTYTVDDAGRRLIKFQITHVSCRNILAKALLVYGNVPYTSKNCMMQKGIYRYENLDVNKVSHALPGYQLPGKVIHELQLVTAGATEFCNEITVRIVNPNKH